MEDMNSMRETDSQVRAKKAVVGYQRLRRLERRVAEAPSPFDAVVARHEAAAAYAETKQMLEPLGAVVQGAGELTTRPQSEWVDPARAAILETLEQPHTVAIGASEQRMEANAAAGVMVSALDAAVAVEAKNSVDSRTFSVTAGPGR
jgi:hypothetical protein